MKYEIDATNQTLGRLASKVAYILRGKNLASYKPEETPTNEVILKNTDKIRFTGLKFKNKVYYKYTGYHGGIKSRTLGELWEKKPEYVIRQSVYNMLPKNKLRDKIIKNLKFQ